MMIDLYFGTTLRHRWVYQAWNMLTSCIPSLVQHRPLNFTDSTSWLTRKCRELFTWREPRLHLCSTPYFQCTPCSWCVCIDYFTWVTLYDLFHYEMWSHDDVTHIFRVFPGISPCFLFYAFFKTKIFFLRKTSPGMVKDETVYPLEIEAQNRQKLRTN